eukprot:scaffold90978_cov28-Tisochrysis_lutea.AAC.1
MDSDSPCPCAQVPSSCRLEIRREETKKAELGPSRSEYSTHPPSSTRNSRLEFEEFPFFRVRAPRWCTV